MNFIKKNILLIISFALPIILIVAVIISARLPSFLLSTKYNFIYISCSYEMDHYYDCGNFLDRSYTVVDGKLSAIELKQNKDQGLKNKKLNVDEIDYPRIFLHDSLINESREITFEEAQTLQIDKLLTSPDGVTISTSCDDGAGFFIFDSGSSSFAYYLTKGKSKNKLNIINTGPCYLKSNFKFLGWVLSNRE